MLKAVRACGPGEGGMQELVRSRLRGDRKLLEAIADGEPMDYEGSLRTLREYVANERWPKKDQGWVREACSLTQHSYWMPGGKPERWRKKLRGRDGRPNRKTTLRCVFTAFLLSDLETHAPFGHGGEECYASWYLLIADGVLRLEAEWLRPTVRWLAGIVLHSWACESSPKRTFWCEGSLGPLLALTLLAARENATTGASHPIGELVRTIEGLESRLVDDDRKHGIDPGEGWLVRSLNMPGRPGDALVVSRAVLGPSLDGLSIGDREAAERLLRKLEEGLPGAEADEARLEAKYQKETAAREASTDERSIYEILSPEEAAQLREIDSEWFQARMELFEALRKLVAFKRSNPVLFAVLYRPRQILRRWVRRLHSR